MKDLILKALDSAFFTTKAITPQTKKQVKGIDIMDVEPINLLKFMKENGVPENAWFGGRDNNYGNGYDSFELHWEVDIPTNEQDNLKFMRTNFPNRAYKQIYDVLTNIGYKRVGFDSAVYSRFKNLNMYDLYVNNEFDLLVEYYSLFFQKIPDN
jgi:hypothetical protein